MKIKNIKIEKILIVILLFVLLLFIGIHEQKNIEIQKAKAELLEAKKPSQIEIQKKELEELERTWQELEKSCQQKPEIEIKIKNKRSEILGLKK